MLVRKPLQHLDPKQLQWKIWCKPSDKHKQIKITGNDLQRWYSQLPFGQVDSKVFQHLDQAPKGLGTPYVIQLEHKNSSGQIVKACPHLGRKKIGPNKWEYFCRIEHTKPDICSGFQPMLEELRKRNMVRTSRSKMRKQGKGGRSALRVSG